MCWWWRLCRCTRPEWVGSVLLVLVQWARLRFRQVELQGEFCNTWPVLLSHLCGWRKRGGEKKENKGEEREKRLGVIGRMSDNEKWSRVDQGTTAAGRKFKTETEFLYSSFQTFFHSCPPCSLLAILPSLSVIREPPRRTPAPHYSPFHP